MNNNNITNPDIQSEISSLKVKSLELVENTVYVLIENYGLKILDISEVDKLKFTPFYLYHPYLKSISLNKYTNKNIIGCIVDKVDQFSFDEIYFELDVKEEYSPKLNRIYLTNKQYNLTSFYNDQRFSYLFENNSNSIILIKRPSIDTKFNKFSIFKLNIPQLSTSDILLPPLILNFNYSAGNNIGISSESTHDILGFVTKNYFTYANPVEKSQLKLEANFNEEGEYSFLINTYDAKDNKTNIKINFYVYSLDKVISTRTKNLYPVVIVIYLFFTSLLYLVYIKYYHNLEPKKINTHSINNNKKSPEIQAINISDRSIA